MIYLILAAAAFVADPPSERCSVVPLMANPEGYFWPLDRIVAFATSAELVVRVRADSVSVLGGPRSVADAPTQVHFTVLELLSGVTPASLTVRGRVVDSDDFNTRPAPYRMVRPSGQRGSCFTDEYRLGAEYLLIMRNAPHVIPLSVESETPRLTPYWAPLAPLNEQVRGPDDPWVQWVRSVLAGS